MTDGEGTFQEEGRWNKQRQLQPCHWDQACQHPTAPALHSWCHSPQQELGRVIEPEHVVIVLHVVLVEQCVELLQLQQHRTQRLRRLLSHQLPPDRTLNSSRVATALGHHVQPCPCSGVLDQCHIEKGEQQDTGEPCVIFQRSGAYSKGSSNRRTLGFRHPDIPLNKPGQAAQSGMGKRELQ